MESPRPRQAGPDAIGATVTMVRNPDVLWRHTLLGTLVLAPDSDVPELLATPGDAIWEALAQPVTEAGLVDQLTELFGAEREVIATDVSALLDELRAAGLMIDVAGSP